MPVKVRVQDCQSIKDSEILIDGFTVLTGPNNSGKTAFMRATKGVFTNAPAGALVRHGESHLTVSVEFGDGGTLVWEKGASVNQYTVNGKVLGLVGRGVPHEVAAFGVQGIEVGREIIWPQIATQFADRQFSGPVFLLDRPGSLLAEVVADVERIGKLSAALAAAEKDKRAATSDLKVRRKDLALLDEELATYAGLDDAVSSVDVLEEHLREADMLRAEITALTSLRDRRASLQMQINTLRGVEDITLPPAETLREANLLQRTVEEARALRVKHSALREEVGALEGVSQIVLPASDSVAEATTARDELVRLAALATRRAQCLQRIQAHGGIDSVTMPQEGELEQIRKVAHALSLLVPLRDRRSEAKAGVARWQAAAQVATALPLDVDTTKAEKFRKGLQLLGSLRDNAARAAKEVEKLDTELGARQADLQEAQDALTAIMGEIDVCPTCRTPMGETHLHKMGAA